MFEAPISPTRGHSLAFLMTIAFDNFCQLVCVKLISVLGLPPVYAHTLGFEFILPQRCGHVMLGRRVGQVFHAGSRLGRTVLRPAVELALIYGRLTHGVNLAATSPEESIVGSRVPILLIHGLADRNIPPQKPEMIRARNPADITLWEVPNAGHCGAGSAAPAEFNARVLARFAMHGRRPARPEWAIAPYQEPARPARSHR